VDVRPSASSWRESRVILCGTDSEAVRWTRLGLRGLMASLVVVVCRMSI
jgi:hypothetical protein